MEIKETIFLYAKIILTAVGIPVLSIYMSYILFGLFSASNKNPNKKINRTFASGAYHILAPVRTYIFPHIAVSVIAAVVILLSTNRMFLVISLAMFAIPFAGAVANIVKNHRTFVKSGFSYIPIAVLYAAVIVVFTLIRLVI